MRKKKNPTISDIAKAVGVSQTTISNYLNQKYTSISRETREKIDKAIRELDYSPNHFARSLKSTRSNTIACLVSDITDTFSSHLLRGICDTCSKHNYQVLILDSNNDVEKENRNLQQAISNGVDGIILYSVGSNESGISTVAKQGVPVLLAGRVQEELEELDYITTNNFEAAYECLEHLKAQGYERVVFFSRPFRNSSQRRQRFMAFQKACQFLFDESADECVSIIEGNNQELYASEIQRHLQNAGEKSVAFFVNSGTSMLHFLNAFKRLDLGISARIGICGFDDWGWSELIGSGITTIRTDVIHIGSLGSEMLINRINNPSAPAQHETIKSTLIIRRSTERLGLLENNMFFKI